MLFKIEVLYYKIMLWFWRITEDPKHVMLGIFLIASTFFIVLQIKNKLKYLMYFNVLLLTTIITLIKNNQLLILIILLPTLISSTTIRTCYLIKKLIKE